MGIGETAMRKLMEGRGPGRPGVAGKVGDLLRVISGGEWCEQQTSLMRGLAFGILDPDGERYRLARLHQRECPACRAYVLSLRGLAAVLPPLALPWGVGGLVRERAPGQARGPVGAGLGLELAAVRVPGRGGGAGIGAGLGGAKLMAGCVLALSIGCVAVVGLPHAAAKASHRQRSRGAAASTVASPAGRASTAPAVSVGSAREGSHNPAAGGATRDRVAAASSSGARVERARREFGPEKQPQVAANTGAKPTLRLTPPTTQAASSSRTEREFGP